MMHCKRLLSEFIRRPSESFRTSYHEMMTRLKQNECPDYGWLTCRMLTLFLICGLAQNFIDRCGACAGRVQIQRLRCAELHLIPTASGDVCTSYVRSIRCNWYIRLSQQSTRTTKSLSMEAQTRRAIILDINALVADIARERHRYRRQTPDNGLPWRLVLLGRYASDQHRERHDRQRSHQDDEHCLAHSQYRRLTWSGWPRLIP